MQEVKFLIPFIGLLIAIVLAFSLAYLLWDISPVIAAMALLVGVSGLLLEGVRVLNRAIVGDL